jgi:hypothetical protein
MSLVFIFSEPDGMSGQMRGGSVRAGEPVIPFTAEEMVERERPAGQHIVFDEPAGP